MHSFHITTALLSSLFAGCVTYDFEPVTPLTLQQTTTRVRAAGRMPKPNLMFLVDRSGSMRAPVDPTLPACSPGGVACGLPPQQPLCNPAVCPTRWSELQGAMDAFLRDQGTIGRLGLLFYPKPGSQSCDTPTLSAEGGLSVPLTQTDDVSTELQQTADQIRQALSTMSPLGGTPTGASLRLLSEYAEFQPEELRQSIVLLLTDGLPNCNDSLTCSCSSGTCKLECLDEAATAQAVEALKARNIRTAVIGFGGDLANPEGLRVLNALADRGGFARTCPAGAPCPQRFYQAANRTELAEVLRSIAENLPGVCTFPLEGDPPADAVSVSVNGAIQPRDTWELVTSGGAARVEALGPLCERIRSTSARDPLNVEVYTVEEL